MEHPSDQQTPDLRAYLNVLKARKWTIMVVLLLAVAAALTASFLQTPLYRGEARVLAKPQLSSGSSPTYLGVDPRTEMELLASEPVAAMVKEELGLDVSTSSLLAGIEVEGPSQTTAITSSGNVVLTVAYVSEDPKLASSVSSSFADNYLEYRAEQALRQLEADLEPLQERVQTTSSQITAISDRIQNAGDDSALVSTLQTQQNILVTRLGVLQQKLDELEATRAARQDSGTVIERANVPSSPSSPNHLQNGLLGGLLGLALGIGLAFLRERLDDRLRGRPDLERILDAPVLATIPRFANRRVTSTNVITLTDPKSVASEAYRSLRTNLQFMTAQRGIRSVLVTSPSAEEGKTVTCANLAVTLAQGGKRVVLMSADLRRPTLERYFKLGNEAGLSTWLSMQSNDLASLIQDPGIPNMRILPSGPIPPNPAELLTSPRLMELIHVLEENADMVLVDSPPTLAVADSPIISPHVGGTVLVVDAGVTARSAVVHARDELGKAGAVILGSVLNALDPSSSRSYYYYGTPYYRSRYAEGLPTGNGEAPAERAGAAQGSEPA